ncbi:MAG: helix-hairpin-helix domain-containing protein [Melioribacteraceae bacterium]|nr:helix-hairpin-helix domain-containing protein [Melioribacteraceae bacterium]
MIIGGLLVHLKDRAAEYDYNEYDYSKVDSVFRSAGDTVKGDNLKDKKVDYEEELLDFSEKEILSESLETDNKLVNINTADFNLLLTLPGIGEKTAEKIIELRKRKNGFKSLDELLEVRGIGKAKLDKLKKFLIIE